MTSDSPHISIAVGVTVGLLASFVQSLGLTIQRKSHVQNQSLPDDQQRVEHRRPLWLLGFAVFISSNILGSLFQIASLPVVILAPLGAVSLLWNAFFARLLLGDVFSPWMILGTILIAGGAVLIAVFGIVPEPTRSLEDLLILFRRPAFIVYFSLLGTAVVACLVITHIVEFSLSRKFAASTSPPLTPPMSPRPLSPPAMSMPLPPPSSVAVTSERTPLLDRKPAPSSRSPTPTPRFISPALARTRLLLALSYASASGILSGMCLLFAKSGVELLLLTIGGKNQFWRWEAWVLLLGLVAFALLQLWYLHKALIFADPTIVCPLAFCFYNLSSIVNGLVYFDQFALLSTTNLLLVTLGIVVLLGGVWLVSFHAGGGGVDVGTWQEGEDTESLSDVVTPGSRPGHLRVITSPGQLESGGATPLSPIAFPSLRSPPLSPDSNVVDDHDFEHGETELARSPARERGKKTRRPRYSFLQPTDRNLPGGGFSIGLSPVSPGFTLVPKRRVSIRSVERRAAMRRTVSEGDIEGVEVPEEGSGEHVEGGTSSDERVGAKARWKWLRGIFTGRE